MKSTQAPSHFRGGACHENIRESDMRLAMMYPHPPRPVPRREGWEYEYSLGYVSDREVELAIECYATSGVIGEHMQTIVSLLLAGY